MATDRSESRKIFSIFDHLDFVHLLCLTVSIKSGWIHVPVLARGVFVLSASIFFYQRKRCWTGN